MDKSLLSRYLNMHIVTTSNKTIKYIPRVVETTNVLRITDEQTNVTAAKQTLSTTEVGNFVSITADFTFVEGRYYYITIGNSADNAEIYRGKVFCTNQTDFEKFTTNNNIYTEYDKTNANEYIVI